MEFHRTPGPEECPDPPGPPPLLTHPPTPRSLLGGQQGGFAPNTTRREIEAKAKNESEEANAKTRTKSEDEKAKPKTITKVTAPSHTPTGRRI